MASESVLQRLEAEFDAPPDVIRAVVDLLERGAPPQFISRFRRDETRDPGEERISAIDERWHFLQDLEARKQAILQQAEQGGGATEELARTLAETQDQDLLDDIYQSFRPRRRTAGMQAEEKGVGPLAQAILDRTLGDQPLQNAAAAYVSAERGLPSPENVLEGVLYILAERYAGDAQLRAQVRDELSRGILTATAAAPDRKGAKRYEEFFAFHEPVRRINASRMLALRRAEREGIIKVELRLPEGRELEIFRARFAAGVATDSQLAEFLDLVFRHAYDQLVRPACEADIRRRAKEKADRETVRAFARNLRSQLLSPPLGRKLAMAVRASTRTVWVVALREDGSLAAQQTLHLREPGTRAAAEPTAVEPAAVAVPAVAAPADTAEPSTTDVDTAGAPSAESAAAPAETAAAVPQAAAHTSEPLAASDTGAAREPTGAAAGEAIAVADTAVADPAAAEESAESAPADAHQCTREEAIERLAQMIAAERPAGIAVPHGRRQEFTQELLDAALARVPEVEPLLVPVDEATSAIFATSAAGRKTLPGAEVGIRTAVSLARRLQDPLTELLTMDPHELGLGHSLNEVHQGMLHRQLDACVASCLARVGVDINTCSTEALARVPGISRELARQLVAHREKAGRYRSLEQLRAIEGVDEAAFLHFAGFLRLDGGDEPLDATAVHPESYDLARRIAAQQGTSVADLLGRSLRHVAVADLVSNGIGRQRVLDVLHALGSFGRDPRGVLSPWRNPGVRSIDDLQVDMPLRGRVTNLTEFGAFVDLGIGQDGLVHISQIPGSRLRDPEDTLRVGEVLTLFVVKIDKPAKRISLTMMKPRHLAEGRHATVGERMQANRKRRKPQDAPVMSRAARAPDRRRSDGRRGGPRRPERDAAPMPRDELGRGPSRGGPRVFTVESDRPVEQSRGHKGELRSLAGLRKLLGRDTPEPEEPRQGTGDS